MQSDEQSRKLHVLSCPFPAPIPSLSPKSRSNFRTASLPSKAYLLSIRDLSSIAFCRMHNRVRVAPISFVAPEMEEIGGEGRRQRKIEEETEMKWCGWKFRKENTQTFLSFFFKHRARNINIFPILRAKELEKREEDSTIRGQKREERIERERVRERNWSYLKMQKIFPYTYNQSKIILKIFFESFKKAVWKIFVGK